MVPDDVVTRPRVEGDREQEILDATLDVLAEVGYDRLTMDAVASQARASKATLYRRWSSKAMLVIDALISHKDAPGTPDTGSLRGDLIAMHCGHGGLTDDRQLAILASVITAIGRDADFAAAFRERFIAPKQARALEIYRRAQERGEIRTDVDLLLVSAALPGIVLHRQFLLGEVPTKAVIEHLIDQLILPAVTAGCSATTTSTTTSGTTPITTTKDIP